jgi:hypothetical protein
MEMKELIQNGLEDVNRVFDTTLDGLTPEELKWQPRSDAKSIGFILFDSIRAEDHLIHRLQGKPQLWESEKWYQKFNKTIEDGGAHYTEEQLAAFVVPDLKELLAYAEVVRKETLRYLKGLKPKDFDKKVFVPSPPAPVAIQAGSLIPPRPLFNPIVGSMLMHLLTRFAERAGEMSYIRGMQRGMGK